MKLKVFVLLLLSMFMLAALAQDAASATVTVAESEEYGQYLADAEGRALYLFVNEAMDEGTATSEETMSEGVRENAVPCTEGCLEAWPPLTAEGEVQAGEGVNPDLLYTAEFTGMNMVVYNGWPLYYFARDEGPGQTNGQGVGRAPNIWYLVTPEGMPLEVEGADAETGGGETGGAETGDETGGGETGGGETGDETGGSETGGGETGGG
jgi:predicted lipoprotein with Yx(FWY)xxD motif